LLKSRENKNNSQAGTRKIFRRERKLNSETLPDEGTTIGGE